jgi:hypothetical protein
MKMGTVRIQLFWIWSAVFVIYILIFLSLPWIRGEISDHDANDAAWKTAYIFLPMLSAFGTFYFAPDFSGESEDTETIHPRQAAAAYGLTALFHGVAFAWFCFYVFFAKFNYPDNAADSFVERVSACHKVLVFLSCLAVLPVGFILKRPDMKSLSSIGQDKPKAIPKKRSKRKPEKATAPAVNDGSQSHDSSSHIAPLSP